MNDIIKMEHLTGFNIIPSDQLDNVLYFTRIWGNGYRDVYDFVDSYSDLGVRLESGNILSRDKIVSYTRIEKIQGVKSQS